MPTRGPRAEEPNDPGRPSPQRIAIDVFWTARTSPALLTSSVTVARDGLESIGTLRSASRYRFFRACDFEGLGFGLGLALDLGLEAARFFATRRRGFDFAFVAAVRRALFDGAGFLFF